MLKGWCWRDDKVKGNHDIDANGLYVNVKKTIDDLMIGLCEDLPLDLTLFEKEGFCQKPNECCKYCIKNADETYFCYKKTYTPSLEPRIA